MVQPSVDSQGSNSSLLVSWSAPLGKWDHYLIRLNSTFPEEGQVLTLTNTSNHHVFGNLSAGQLYFVQVTVCSGPTSTSSQFVSNATCKSGYFL